MIRICDIDNFFNNFCSKDLSEEWDNDGVMLCKDTQKQINKVLCALEITPECVNFAKKNKIDLIVTHHPFIFRPLKNLDGNKTDFETLEKLIKNDISVLSYHTRLDKTKGGVNDVFAKVIGLENVKTLSDDGLGRMGELCEQMTYRDFAKLLKQNLSCKNIRACKGKDTVKKVALVGGSGKDYVYDALKMGADAFVTSEIPHHIFIEMKRLGLSLFDCGHYYTENVVVRELCNIIENNFKGLCVFEYDVKSPYECI